MDDNSFDLIYKLESMLSGPPRWAKDERYEYCEGCAVARQKRRVHGGNILKIPTTTYPPDKSTFPSDRAG